jgi:hypothetical protein
MNSFFSTAGNLRVTASTSVNLSLSVNYIDTVNATGSYIALTPVAPPAAAVTGLPELRTLVGNGWSLSRTNNADQELWLTSLTTGQVDRGSNFDQTGSGWVRAGTTDDYVFWITSDDRSEFKLYDDAGNLIAHAIDTQANGDPGYNTSWSGQSFGNTHYSSSVRLDAGRYYRFEVKHREDGGTNEFFRVGYTLAQDKPANPLFVVSVAASSPNYPPVGTLSGTTGNTNDERPANAFEGVGASNTDSLNKKYLNFDEFGNSTTGRNSGVMVRLSSPTAALTSPPPGTRSSSRSSAPTATSIGAAPPGHQSILAQRSLRAPREATRWATGSKGLLWWKAGWGRTPPPTPTTRLSSPRRVVRRAASRAVATSSRRSARSPLDTAMGSRWARCPRPLRPRRRLRCSTTDLRYRWFPISPDRHSPPRLPARVRF